MQKAVLRVDPIVFEDFAKGYFAKSGKAVDDRTFRAFFKISSVGCSDLWYKLTQYTCPTEVENKVRFSSLKPNHLLWTLHYMHTYASEDVCSTIVGVTPKTYRKYKWAIILFLSNLSRKLVSRERKKFILCKFL